MKSNSLPFLLPILLFSLFLDSQAQALSSQIKNKNNQISFLIGYSPVYVGSNVGYDKRLAVSFRLIKEKVVYDFDVEYYGSDNPRSRLLRNNYDLWLSTNRQKTVGYGINIGISKAVVKNTHVGVGLSGNYLDISENLNESVHLLETGEEITDHGLSPMRRDANFFSPGMFVQTDLSLPIRGKAQFYLKQKFNLMYIGDRFESSFWDTWISYTIFGGLKFNI